MLIVVLIALLVLVVLMAKTIDLKRKREAEALHLQGMISDALLRERRLLGLAVTATARVPWWRGSPVTITLSGLVPSADHRQAVLDVVNAETSRISQEFRIDNLIVLAPVMPVAS